LVARNGFPRNGHSNDHEGADLPEKAVMSPKEHDDKRLVRRLLDRNDEAFEEFFEAMYPALYRFALPNSFAPGHRERRRGHRTRVG
jgi:hypothetical protein